MTTVTSCWSSDAMTCQPGAKRSPNQTPETFHSAPCGRANLMSVVEPKQIWWTADELPEQPVR